MAVFLRRTWSRYSKLGKKRKKKQVWRKPKGRDNKMREKRRGWPSVVSIGYKKGKSEKKNFKIIRNLKDLTDIGKNEIAIIGSIGKRKKIEVVKKAKEIKISIQNINIEKFLKKFQKEENKNESK
ncbi:MAG TPA: 50S ribosomal protein L32e [Candidatus Pacearchaeota archaeon]|nr:50S ribosomal protein L32e [Candidatus Pacearchaeota archaeon]